MSKLYERFSLMVGVAAVFTLVFYLITKFNYCVIFAEPFWFIRIPEIIMGIIVMPYYLKKIFGGKKDK